MTIIDLRSYDPTADDAPLPLRGRQMRQAMHSVRPQSDAAQVRTVAKAARKAYARWFAQWEQAEQERDEGEAGHSLPEYSEDEQGGYSDWVNMGGMLIDDYRGWGATGGDDAA